MNVREIMTQNPEWIEVTDSIQTAAAKLFQLDVRHLPVKERGRLVGIVSDRDLQGFAMVLQEEFQGGDALNAWASSPVGKVMKTEPITVEPEDSLADAIDLMVEHKLSAILVVEVNTERLVGIVSYIDILRAVRDLVE